MSESRRQSAQQIVVRVQSVKADFPVAVRFLGEYAGLETHRKGDRPVPCLGEGDCPIATHRLALIWKGYAAAEVWDPIARHWLPVVQEITESLEELLRGRTLRGEVWALSRGPSTAKNAPVLGVLCQQLSPDALPTAFDIVPVLLRLYHVTSLRLGARNPLPPKVLLSPSKDAAPEMPAELLPVPGRELSPEEQKAAQEAWAAFKRSGYTNLPPNASEAPPEAKNGRAGSHGRK